MLPVEIIAKARRYRKRLSGKSRLVLQTVLVAHAFGSAYMQSHIQPFLENASPRFCINHSPKCFAACSVNTWFRGDDYGWFEGKTDDNNYNI